MNSDSQALLDKVDHFQGLAAKLAVSVLKLKLQGNDNYDQMMIEKASFNDQFLALSEKGTELRWLYAKVMDKTGVIFDLRQENDQLMKENMRMLSEYQSKAAALEVDRTLMEQLQSENQSLKEISSDLLTEREASSKLRSQLMRTEVSLSELRAAMLNTDNSLEEVRQDRNRLSHEVDRLHVSIDALEKEKRSFSGCLHEYKEKIAQLSNRVTSMENYATSNSMQIHELESKLVSKMNKANMPINKASQDNMRSLVPSVDIQEANVDVAITSLRDSIDAFIQEFDHIVLQLDVSENDRNVLRDDSVAVTDSTTPIESEPSLTEDHIEPKESKGFMSEEDLDRIRTFMAKAQQITADSERERNMLKMEVKRLRDDLERAEEELALAREDLLTINRMRNAVSQSKALLEKSEREKNQLKMENESIKSFMSASMETTASSSNHRQSVVSQVSSTERFKVEKGQSMFDMLKGTKKSGRKDFVKYRRAEE
jgi:chromosome segregation ATPase